MDLDDDDDEAYLLMAEQAEAAHTGGNGATARPQACDPHWDRGTFDSAARSSDPTHGGIGGSISADPRTNALGAIKQTRATDSFRDIRDGELVITGLTPPLQTGGREVEEVSESGPDGLHLKRAETLLPPSKVSHLPH